MNIGKGNKNFTQNAKHEMGFTEISSWIIKKYILRSSIIEKQVYYF